MIWTLLIISLGLASARENVEPEYLDELFATGQDEKFAELLGIEKHLVRPNNSEERSEGSILNQASFLGDILLTEEQERNALNFNYYTGSRWPNGRVPYTVSNDFNANERKEIDDACNAFNAKSTKVKLVKRGRESDYVHVFSGNGCWSYLGKIGGQQALSLQKSGCVHPAVVQHEFIHAIGLTHEQCRKDRDNHVEILWGNIPESWRSQYQKLEGNGWWDIGTYDPYSCMHYPMWSPETYKDAFKFKYWVDRNRIGHQTVTNWDVYKIDVLYS